MLSISVVIPAQNAAQYLPRLLDSIESQTQSPLEIIIVDSSKVMEASVVVDSWKGSIPIVYHHLGFAYPGHARNVGVGLARADWIAFLDCRTIPDKDWLEKSFSAALQNNVQIVTGFFSCKADSSFKKILLAATYGNTAVRSLPGSLVRRETFNISGGFIPTLRAGEDSEWMNRLDNLGVTKTSVETPLLCYEGFPDTLGEAVRKWNIYALSKAVVDVKNYQKLLYGTMFFLLCLLLVRKWNYHVAHWKTDSILFIPNITKIYLAILFVLYAITRGLIFPLRKKVKLSFLLPFRWIELLFVRFCLDLAKAPGMILGAVILFAKRVTQLYISFNKWCRDYVRHSGFF